jgi:hypothetical protein
MDRFPTVRDAKEYLIRRILAQAGQDGIYLSDIERKMLYFSEGGWTLPEIMAVSREFDQTHDYDDYEKKIGQIIRRVQRPDSNRDENWDEAVQRVRDEDHYLLVLIDGAAGGSTKLSGWEIVGMIVGSVVVVAILLPVTFFVFSHVDNPAIQKLIFGGTLLALVVVVALVGSRRHRVLRRG